MLTFTVLKRQTLLGNTIQVIRVSIRLCRTSVLSSCREHLPRYQAMIAKEDKEKKVQNISKFNHPNITQAVSIFSSRHFLFVFGTLAVLELYILTLVKLLRGLHHTCTAF